MTAAARRQQGDVNVPGTSKLFEMLQQACAFPLGIPAFKVDPDVTRTYDLGKDNGPLDSVSAANPFADKGNRSSRE